MYDKKTDINLILLVFFCLFASIGFNKSILNAQESGSSYEYQSEELPTKSRLSKTLAESPLDKYDYRKEKEEKKEKKKAKEPVISKSREPLLSANMREILKYSLFGLVILLLSFIAIRLVTGGLNINNKAVKKDQVYSIHEIEENLHDVDVEAFLQQALSQQDYKLAIRLYYLAILKELSIAGFIQWKKDKTNGVYLREMRGHERQTAFRKTTYIYEYVWFNEDIVFGEKEFEEVRPLFKKLLTAFQPALKNS